MPVPALPASAICAAAPRWGAAEELLEEEAAAPADRFSLSFPPTTEV